ncbi:hypothetical protein BCR43DRAFT_486549 [Syncephalastrum racemosum]|uniref:PH domain-containing protein n=1 Tax=Syncephalastrum racemosum TaxID=13706 RepID=A0A1X2HPD0_SYNRA|nr:hypothetical protein BCR43DRAFT_486549 [Syncephalastrum racemosum]
MNRSHSQEDTNHYQGDSNSQPRRSSSQNKNKRSFVATLTSAIATTSSPTIAAPRNNSSDSLTNHFAYPDDNDLLPPCGTRPPADMQDIGLYKPLGNGARPCVWSYNTMRGWLTRHVPPSYSFTKTSKTRYVILADRMLYTFKSDKPGSATCGFLELTKSTSVFATDYFSGMLYCIEIRRRGEQFSSWYLQAEDADTMKIWLERLKKTVYWLRSEQPGICTLDQISGLQTEHDALVNSKKNQYQHKQWQHNENSPTILSMSPRNRSTGGRSSSDESSTTNGSTSSGSYHMANNQPHGQDYNTYYTETLTKSGVFYYSGSYADYDDHHRSYSPSPDTFYSPPSSPVTMHPHDQRRPSNMKKHLPPQLPPPHGAPPPPPEQYNYF